MRTNGTWGWRQRSESGLSLAIVAVGMVFLLGVLGLGIDLASLYVGRTQAQRSADAAALAAAQAFVDGGCTSGLNSDCITMATNRASSVGATNLVAGVAPNISVTFNTANPQNPQVTVVAARTATYSNAMPTFFVKIFGIQTANVSATATAEAFNPSGSGMSVGTTCLKPWLMPNCDPNHPVLSTDSRANPNCPQYDSSGNPIPGYNNSYFISPPPPFGSGDGSIVNPGQSPTGAIGELLSQLKPGDPSAAPVPSKFMPVCIPPGTVPAVCPSCANGGVGGTNSASLYHQNIECCNQTIVSCGANTVQPINGNMVGPTGSGVDCLINESPSGSGQDILNTNLIPFTVTAGSNNPFFPAGSTISLSDSPSTVTVPIYDGAVLCPGSSCPATITVNVLGFLQIFVKGEFNPQSTVQAYVLNIAGCGGGGGSSGGSNTIATGASPVPVRLIYPSP